MKNAVVSSFAGIARLVVVASIIVYFGHRDVSSETSKYSLTMYQHQGKNEMTRTLITSIIMALALFITLSTNAAPANQNDSLAKYSFRLEIDGVDAGQFAAVEGPGIEQEVIEYQNGDDPLIRKRPGRVKYGDVTLTRAFAANSVLDDWIENAGLVSGNYERKTVAIILQEPAGNDLKRWTLFQSPPGIWSLYPLERGHSKSDLMESLAIVLNGSNRLEPK